ncbi:MAG: hypothetical protein US65_C0053G0003 [Candidatus Yanofskybacteria bacterium GW2011_GWC2_37_9]|uniref:Uncharacterized protein n=1 Tax=Candidatus Yanofskybacteria bacterium GW2011_GWC2_37_9 TaxID=1619028 RepID=A0A0G0HT78_9BACT|nr:MAG: hypothetical protein US65_C0053G0003 [Candidatus Yanofskybacteria bacterium GW2011_GWC2_37_9]
MKTKLHKGLFRGYVLKYITPKTNVKYDIHNYTYIKS